MTADPPTPRDPQHAQSALSLHPVQYAIITGPGFPRWGAVKYNTEHLTHADFTRGMPPGLAADVRIERYNRCPNCEQWSPCDVRQRLLAAADRATPREQQP